MPIKGYKKGRRLIDQRECAHKICCHHDNVYRLVREGRFPKPIKLPGSNKNLWAEDIVDRWIAEQLKAA